MVALDKMMMAGAPPSLSVTLPRAVPNHNRSSNKDDNNKDNDHNHHHDDARAPSAPPPPSPLAQPARPQAQQQQRRRYDDASSFDDSSPFRGTAMAMAAEEERQRGSLRIAQVRNDVSHKDLVF